ncbi:MAG: hypothetical protein MO846_09395 [Candidatus Devosia symbiotica]|nr:hypothetical protein [Candidatus Devosia symbiotica]
MLRPKEWIVGFMVLEAADIEEAITLAADEPLEGLAELELWPFLDEQHSQTGQDRSAFFRR